jgi:hypothetical protein
MPTVSLTLTGGRSIASIMIENPKGSQVIWFSAVELNQLSLLNYSVNLDN